MNKPIEVLPEFHSGGPRTMVSRDAENYYYPTPLHQLDKQLPLRVLSEEDLAFWRRNGYVVIKQAVPRQTALDTLAQVWEFAGKDPQRPESWLRPDSDFKEGWSWEKELYAKGMVEMYHHQLLWDNRTSQRVYDAFVDIWDMEALWVSVDRVNLNFPTVGNRAEWGSFIHWDIDINAPVLPLRVQGLIQLTDTEDETGGFQCSPDLFHHLEEWRKGRAHDSHPTNPDPAEYSQYPVAKPKMEAGDLLIFNGLLLHGIARNVSQDKVRSVQYVTMTPALMDHATLRKQRISWYQDVVHPDTNVTFIGDAKQPEAQRYGPAQLTPLGRKLLGLDVWPD
ncbi:DUF1479 family protein [Jeongeupia wiesaeckerbachi]|uniref:phytanoyl-CoA dioxygenase family protein n=1 Tax=Jeongeupia wiesaeckerbachi TaxID=3051218 RepID=UPI003D805642